MAPIADESQCILKTIDGLVRGYKDETDEGTYYKFKSIPYANPPLGRLRFLPPTPVTPWTEIMDCTKDAPVAYNTYKCSKNKSGSEDCLYIEISTPSLNPDKPIPVMFWVGCFGFACNIDRILDPTLLNAKGIMFVRCGFRLGPFGFLSINDFTAPGNCGLKDIVMALKWVQRNIRSFGGDPNNVTMFGSSSGGAIVHLMTLSPLATGLFHKVIIQSACALNNWSMTKNPSLPVIELGKLLGVKKTCLSDIVDELRSLPATDIMDAFVIMTEKAKTEDTKNMIDALFKPCIELEFEGQPTFITRTPESLLKSGNFNKVPLIIGSNKIEAAPLEILNRNFYNNYKKINQNKDLLVPRFLAGEPKLSKIIGQQLLKFYLDGDGELREYNKTEYLQLISDYYFLYHVNKTLRLHRQYAPECPVYYYVLNNAGQWSVPSEWQAFNTIGHSAELPFIFRIKLPDSPVCKGSKDSITTRARIVKMWTNFAKYGNPTPDENDSLLQIEWKPVEDKDKLNYLSIGSELTKGMNPFKERMSFWDDLLKEHRFLRAFVYVTDLGVSW